MSAVATPRHGRGTSAESLALTREDARILTDRIKHAAEHLYQLLLEAHEQEAWRALGYPSWREYAAIEFGKSQSYLYRLLDQGRVLRALEQAAGSPIGEIVSEHVARQIKPHLAVVTSEIVERIKNGEAAPAAVTAAVNTVTEKRLADPTMAVVNSISRTYQTRIAYLTTRKAKDRSNRMVENIVASSKYLLTEVADDDDDDAVPGVNVIDFSALDPTCISEWVQELREAARQITRFAARLEKAGRP
ncbi:MAG: hypothetical protein ABI603_01680 [Acidobacteriota bacterium]